MDRRHFFQAALGTRHGITTEYGRGAEAVIDEIVARTPSVIAEVHGQLQAWLPERVTASIFGGLAAAAQRMGAGA